MLERIVRKLVNLLQKNGLVSLEEYEEFSYVLLGNAESLLVIISILLIGIIIGQGMPTVSFLIYFFALRRKTGGYHLNSYCKCYICTVCLYVFITVFSYLVFKYEKIVISCAVIAGLIIMYIGNINHPNMDLEVEEAHELKISARIIVVLEILAIFFMKWLGNMELIITYSSMAIILCATLLIIAKLVGQEVKK